jgi:hypothetical protein
LATAAVGRRSQRVAAVEPLDTGTALVAAGLLVPATAAVLGDAAASATQQITGALTVVEQQLL